MKAPAVCSVLALFTCAAPAAPFPLGPGNLIYTQDFDTLPSTPNNVAATPKWADDSTLPGWWFYTAGDTTTPIGLAGAAFDWYISDGSTNPNNGNNGNLHHGFYSLGADGNSDRALGGSPTTNLGELSAILILHNTAAGPLQLTRAKFKGEAYRTNTTGNNRDALFMWWKTAATVSALTTNTTALCTSNTTVFVSGTTTPTSTTTNPTSYYITGWTHLPTFNYVYFNGTGGVVVTPPATTAIDAVPPTPVTVAAGEYLAIRWSNINDQGTDGMIGLDDLELTFGPYVPPLPPTVTALNSPGITFTPSANGAVSYTAPLGEQVEIGWSGGTGNSSVQTQPNSGAFTGTAKYFRINAANITFTSQSVEVGSIAGQDLKGHIELGLYTTSNTGFEVDDVLNARMEVAVDGNFSNTAAGNIRTANFVDEPGVDTNTFDDTIGVATPYVDLNAVGFPTADFIFHPFEQTIPIPAAATAARARIIFASGANITGSEHVLLDNVRFSLAGAIPAADADGDGQSDASEAVAGTNPNDPASVLRISAADVNAANEVSLTWSSIAGKKYQPMISPDLGNPTAWAPLGSVITATGSETSIPPGTAFPAGSPKYFVRIAVVP